MNNVFGEELPAILTDEELIKNFKDYKEGSSEAREIIIIHNLRFVLSIVHKKYNWYKNFEELVMIGTIGLIKAVDNYDMSKEIRFITFASKCIENEIMMYFRKEKRHIGITSYDEIVEKELNENKVNLFTKSDFYSDVTKNYEVKETLCEMQEIINNLNDDEKLLYELYFVKKLTQDEISSLLNITQSYTSRKIKRLIEKIKNIAIKKDVIQYSDKKKR